jgi:hypothetical protein
MPFNIGLQLLGSLLLSASISAKMRLVNQGFPGVDYFLSPFVWGSSAQKIHFVPFACFLRDESNPRCSS